ncbi:hypothetical protein KVT40_005453 [Elsinoe batatas]|uniref:Paf1 complex protein n=1 Tax=Elsinoe batatas TaxID=2601811 RepID=A0A8K0L1J8_9PEZI|nr:hypothetical protein KVT40_005453 [Elsinoe batatas]
MAQRTYHQDYVVRIRYSNTLPPPPNPPKLLDIPGTGLSGGQYTNASYGTRLAREQPLNIEADAELGMPIDLAAINARDPPPLLHPHDRALLKPLSQIGKGNTGAGATFLRKTEYISSDQGIKRYESSTSRDLFKIRNDPKRKNNKHLDKEDPLNIVKNVVKGFDIAYPKDAHNGDDTRDLVKGAEITASDITAWSNPKHPKNSGLKLLDSYPVLPDLDAIPGLGSYILLKYNTDPSAAVKGYDPRLDMTILKPKNANNLKLEERIAAYEKDLNMVRPTAEYDYDMYMLDDVNSLKGMKRKCDVNDPDRDDENLYTSQDDQGQKVFKYKRIRAYETYQQQGDGENPFADSVALALHDPEFEVGHDGEAPRLPKGAYIYPVLQRTYLRPKRKVQNAYVDDSVTADKIHVVIRDADEDELGRRLAARAKYDTAMISTAQDGDADEA